MFRIGKLLSAAFDAGANSASDISYTCSNYDDLYKEALKDAVSDAANKGITKDANGELIFADAYTVSFDTDGGTPETIEDQKVITGETATQPDDPTKDNNDFIGWYKGETKFDFSTAVTENTTLKAKWEIVHKHDDITFKPFTINGEPMCADMDNTSVLFGRLYGEIKRADFAKPLVLDNAQAHLIFHEF